MSAPGEPEAVEPPRPPVDNRDVMLAVSLAGAALFILSLPFSLLLIGFTESDYSPTPELESQDRELWMAAVAIPTALLLTTVIGAVLARLSRKRSHAVLRGWGLLGFGVLIGLVSFIAVF